MSLMNKVQAQELGFQHPAIKNGKVTGHIRRQPVPWQWPTALGAALWRRVAQIDISPHLPRDEEVRNPLRWSNTNVFKNGPVEDTQR